MARRKKSSTPALDALTDSERGAVLGNLLRSHPELLAEADELATRTIAAVSTDTVADEVMWALEHISFDDLTARAGKHRGGYTDPHEAAWELVEQALDSFVDDLRRAATVGQEETATTIAAGILTGLRQLPEPADGSVLAWAGPDIVDDLEYQVLREADKVGIRLPATFDDDA